jgi:hypothetical protein
MVRTGIGTAEDYMRFKDNVERHRRKKGVDWNELKNRRELNLFLKDFLGYYPTFNQTNFTVDEFNIDVATTHYEELPGGYIYKQYRGEDIIQIKKGEELITRKVRLEEIRGRTVFRDIKTGRFLKWRK